MAEDRHEIIKALGGRLTTNDGSLIDRLIKVVTLARAEQRERDAANVMAQRLAEHDNSSMSIGINIGVQRAVDAIRNEVEP